MTLQAGTSSGVSKLDTASALTATLANNLVKAPPQKSKSCGSLRHAGRWCVNESKTELIRIKALMREKQIQKIWKEKHAAREAREVEAQEQVRLECARARDLDSNKHKQKTSTSDLHVVTNSQNPNAAFPKPFRQGKTQVIRGDCSCQMLSRVFLHGKWVYAL
mmetsp:Transcript_1781/g.3041  ORF Transcript_1781/g.3041 Transcript_1781/m.3041 type:complete len:163 (+) Transcript_1781:87-575(+)